MKEALLSFLKKLIIFAVVAGIIVLLVWLAVSAVTSPKKDAPVDLESTLDLKTLPQAPETANVGDKRLVEENDRFALYIDAADTDIALVDKQNDKIYFSNPKEADAELAINDTMLPNVSSMLVLTYYDAGANAATFTSRKDAVGNNQVYFHKIDNGIQIVYKLGKDEGLRVIPPVMTVETFERYYNALEGYDQQDIVDFYRFVDKDNIRSDERSTLLENYPALSEQSLYIVRNLNANQKKKMEAYSAQVGFTYDDMVAEMELVGYEREDVSISFVVPVNLTIDEEGFVAQVVADEIITPSSYKIATLTLLTGFGATADEDGFLLMPDGSGALIERVSKGSTDVYAKALYGNDETLLREATNEAAAQAVMPVFGMKAGDSSLFAVVEEGASLGIIRANSIGGTNVVASIAPSFTVTPVDFKDYTGLLRVPTGTITPKEGAKGRFTVRYYFYAGEDITYSDMANSYRQYLIDNGVLTKNNETTTPFYAQLLGSVRKNKTVVGIPIEYDAQLTTFPQAVEIMDKLSAAGVNNIRAQYKGIANKGLGNGGYDRYDIIKALGGENGYNQMMADAQQKGYIVFPDANLLQIYDTHTSSVFNYREDSTRKADNTVATGFRYNPATLRQSYLSPNYLLVAPDVVGDIFDRFLPRFTALSNQSALSLASMGEVVNSTYEKNNIIARNATETYYTAVLSKADAAMERLMVETGNAYTWPYVTDILGIPTGSSMNYQETEAIPFVQMVLHGYINYASIPVNSGSNVREELLKAIETGAGLSFKLMYAENITLQETGFTEYYSYHYADWIDEAAQLYKEAASVLDQVAGAAMVKHETLGDKVFMTTYDNGKAIIVNYGDTAVEVLGQTVPAEGYCIKGVENNG